MKFLLFSVVLPTLALAGFTSNNPRHQLPKRQSGCNAGESVCGNYCIPSGYTCCPDMQGGCPAGEYCSMGDNGQYGCCDNGQTCTGDGGVNTIFDSSTSSYTYTSSNFFTTTTSSDIFLSTSEPTTTPHIAGGSQVTVTASSTSNGNGGAVTVTASGNSADNLKHNGAAAAFILGVAALL